MADAQGNRHAVILSGGGAYGAYEVGVLKAMLTGQMPQTGHVAIDPDIYTGTSVGAINGAILVSQAGAGVSPVDAISFLEDVWIREIAEGADRCGNGIYRIRADPFRYLRPECLANPAQAAAELAGDGAYIAQSLLERTFNFITSPGTLALRALEFVDLSTFIAPAPIERLLTQLFSVDDVRRSPKDLRIVAANWATGAVKVFENRDFTDADGYKAVLASAAVPGFFPPQYIGGEPYVDGGVVMNTPLKCAIEAGGTVLHVVYLDPDIEALPLKVLQNTYQTMDRTIVIHNATVVNEDIETAEWINEGLDTVERLQQGIVSDDTRAFIRVASQIARRVAQGTPYRRLTIHRYHPQYDVGEGAIGILNFDRGWMQRLIDLGFSDTVGHDCDESQCVRPD